MSTRLLRRALAISFFVPYFIYELVISNLRVAVNVVWKGTTVRPAIIAVPTRARGAVQLTLLANLVSLTPGTLVVDISSDHNVFYLHTMHIEALDNFPQFETNFLRMFQ